jgi:membrane-associated protease RseP (regulator of RpoE activity)
MRCDKRDRNERTRVFLPRLGWIAAVALAACAFAVRSAPSADAGAAFRAALESIRVDDLRQEMKILTDDDKAGREPGTVGSRAAAEYLRRQLAAAQVQPAGDGGGYFQTFAPNYCNVLGKIKGSDPQLAKECILVGGHYDHLGLGIHGASLGPTGAIHPGADDNASGTTGVLELAQAFAALPKTPRRTVVFAFWDAEEKGLLGSKHWVAHPTVAIEQLKFAVNLDMIGRMRNEQLFIFGSRTGYGLRRLVSSCNEESPPMQIQFPWGVRANSDHYSFIEKSVPTLMFHTGAHEQLHRPTDRPERIDYLAEQRIVRTAFAVLYDLANRDAMPQFREAGRSETDEQRQEAARQKPQLPERLGVVWDTQATPGRGVRICQVAPNSAAAKAGLALGDRVLKFDGRDIRTDVDLIGAVATAPNATVATVEKSGKPAATEVPVQLMGQRLRFGFLWRLDDAEPRTVVLTQVIPGTPAAKAGLEAEDRILDVDGRSFADEKELAARLDKAAGGLRFRIDRNGRLRVIEVQLETASIRRAA